MALSPQDKARAESFGRLAAKKNCGVTACPYEADGDADQRTLAARFVHAFIKAGGKVAVVYDNGTEDTAPRARQHGSVRVSIVRTRS